MKLADIAQDRFGADPHARGFGKPPAEPSSDAFARFAGVLSGIGSGAEPNDPAELLAAASIPVTDVNLGQADPSKTATTVLAPQTGQSGKDDRRGDSRLSDLLAADAPIGTLLTQAAAKTSQSTTNDNALRPAATRTRSSAGETGESSRDLVTMLLSNAGPSKTSTLQVASPARRQPAFKEESETIAIQREIGAAAPAKADAEHASQTSAVASPPARPIFKDDNPSSQELMAMLLVGLGPSAAQDAKPIGTNAKPAEASDMLRTFSTSAVSPTDGQASAIADRVAIGDATSLSDIAVSTHLAPGTDRAANNDHVMAQSAASAFQPATSGFGLATPNRSDGSRVVSDEVETSDASSLEAGHREEARIRQTVVSKTEQQPNSAQDGQPKDPSSAIGPLDVGSLSPRESTLGAKIAMEVARLADQSAASPVAISATSIVPARTLTLRVDQVGLGSIDIRMHVSGKTLDLQLTVSDPETLTILRRNREALTSAIEDRQYQIHSLVIQDVSAPPAASASHTNAGDAGTGTSAGMQASADQRGDRNHGNRESGMPPRRDDEHNSSSLADRNPRRGSLFV